MISERRPPNFWWPKSLLEVRRVLYAVKTRPITETTDSVFDRRQDIRLISTSDGKRPRGNMHTGGRRRNSLRLLLPHHSTRADVPGD